MGKKKKEVEVISQPDQIEEILSDEEMNEFMKPELLEDITTTDLEVIEEKALLKPQEDICLLPDDLKNTDLKQFVVDLRKNIDENRFELGRVLYFIDINKEFEPWGYESMAQYLKSEEAGKERTARYLLDIHRWFVDKIKDKKKIEAIKSLGWSKAKEIMSIDTTNKGNDQLDKWIDTARDISVRSLTDIIKEEKNINKNQNHLNNDNQMPEDRDEIHFMKFKFYNDQYAMVQSALDLIKKETHSESDAHNLSLLCQQFVVDCDVDKDPIKNASTWAELFEKKTKFKVIVVDIDGNPVYGEQYLDND